MSLYILYTCFVIVYMGYPCFTAKYVEFSTPKRMYNVGDNVTLTCNVSTDWLTVSFRRNDTDIGYCSKPVQICGKDPSADRRYDLHLHKSHSSIVIKNVTMDDNGVGFECQWTSYTDSLILSITDEATSSPSPSDNDNFTDETPIFLIVIGGFVLVLVVTIVSFIVIRYVKKYREHTHTEHDAASINNIELSDKIATCKYEKVENTEKYGIDEIQDH